MSESEGKVGGEVMSESEGKVARADKIVDVVGITGIYEVKGVGEIEDVEIGAVEYRIDGGVDEQNGIGAWEGGNGTALSPTLFSRGE